MAQERVMEVAVLNITTADPSPNKYHNIFIEAFNFRRPIKVRGKEYMIIEQIEKSDDGIINGTFARFTEIDTELPWFDLDNLGEASEEAVQKISIPEALRPNYSNFFFKFNPRQHLLSFETRGKGQRVSPYQVEKYFRALFESTHPDEIVYVNLIADQASVERILALKYLKRLEIYMELPNPDALDELEKKLKERMKKLNVRKISETYDAVGNEGIHPDQEMRDTVTIASANGEVVARGKEGDQKIEISTKKFPLQAQRRYDTELTTDRQAFESAAIETMQKRQQQLAAQRRQE